LKGSTFPSTNIAPLKIGLPKRKLVSKPQLFRGYASLREVILGVEPFFESDIFFEGITSLRGKTT